MFSRAAVTVAAGTNFVVEGAVDFVLLSTEDGGEVVGHVECGCGCGCGCERRGEDFCREMFNSARFLFCKLMVRSGETIYRAD